MSGPTDDAAGDGETDDATADRDPFEALDDATGAAADGDPFDALDAAEDRVDADHLLADPFAEVDVGGAGAGRPTGADGDSSPAPAVALGDDRPDADAAPDERVVPKRSYCENCEHFDAPPTVACRNPGTEIRGLVDMEHFLVANCPVVAERLDRTFDDD